MGDFVSYRAVLVAGLGGPDLFLLLVGAFVILVLAIPVSIAIFSNARRRNGG